MGSRHFIEMLELLTLGGVYVRGSDGTRLGGAVAQRRSLALLSVLAAHGDAGVRRDRLLALLWADADPEKSRHALTQSLYHIRRALECDDVFVVTGADIRLNAERMQSDVARFGMLVDAGHDECALSLYAGPFMDGFVLPSPPEFEQWASVQRDKYQRLAGGALERLAANAERNGEWAEAVSLLRRLVALDPLSATATIALMRAMWASGDRPGAIQQGRVHGQLLRDELELEPDAGVTALIDEMRAARDTSARTRITGEIEALKLDELEVAPSLPLVEPPVTEAMPRVSRRQTFVRAAIAACALLSVAAAVKVASRLEGAASAASIPITSQPIVVAPFRVSGTDASLAYLREGLVELLSARLGDDSAASAIDPGRVLGAWRKAKLTGAADTPQPAAREIARRLGAGRVIVGGVVGNAQRLVLSASLLAVASGETRAQAQVEGPADSITVLVDRLGAKLLAAGAGEGDRFTDRFTPSLAALHDFLEGQAAYRRGDYAAAVPAYERALAHDSSFALAAMHLALAADWLNDAEQHDRALAIAWSNRDDLSERDLAHLVAFAGPRFPAPSLETEQFAAWERAVAAAPDRAEVWYELGERLFRAGGVLGVQNPHVRAKATLAHALELEPGHMRARRLLIMLAARTGDTALLTRIASREALRDSVGGLSGFLRWRVALARGDSMELRRVRAAMPELNDESLRAISMSSIDDAVGIDDGERAARITLRRAGHRPVSFDAVMEQHYFALNEGRPGAALDITNQIDELQPGSRAQLRLRVLDALYSEGDPFAAAAAADSLAVFADAPLSADPDARGLQLADACVLEQWRLGKNASGTARRAINRLRSSKLPRKAIPISANQLACAQILDASLAVVTGAKDAPGRVATLDSLMLVGPAVSDASSYAHILVGRLYLRLGNPRAALAAFRRRTYMTGWSRYLSTVRREEAELAIELNEPAIAKASFGRYLAIRRHPEPRLAAGIESLRHRARALETQAGQ